jgi:hypothetical protein
MRTTYILERGISYICEQVALNLRVRDAKWRPQRRGIKAAWQRNVDIENLNCCLAVSHLLWERNLPVAWPDPSQPGMGHLSKKIVTEGSLENASPVYVGIYRPDCG